MSEAGPLIFILLMLVVFYLFLLRPQRVQQRRMRELQAALELGDEVVLSSGIFGTVRALDEARADIEVAPGTVITVARQVVVRRADELAAPQGVEHTGSAEGTERPDGDVDDAPTGTPGHRDEHTEGRG